MLYVDADEHLPFDDLQGRIAQLYHEWRGTQRQTDDVLVVGVEL